MLGLKTALLATCLIAGLACSPNDGTGDAGSTGDDSGSVPIPGTVGDSGSPTTADDAATTTDDAAGGDDDGGSGGGCHGGEHHHHGHE